MNLDALKKVVDEAYPYVDSIGLTGLGGTLVVQTAAWKHWTIYALRTKASSPPFPSTPACGHC